MPKCDFCERQSVFMFFIPEKDISRYSCARSAHIELCRTLFKREGHLKWVERCVAPFYGDTLYYDRQKDFTDGPKT